MGDVVKIRNRLVHNLHFHSAGTPYKSTFSAVSAKASTSKCIISVRLNVLYIMYNVLYITDSIRKRDQSRSEIRLKSALLGQTHDTFYTRHD